jgi:dTDP-4-dehydrorhamnose 3,5-epimerase-like enzyme
MLEKCFTFEIDSFDDKRGSLSVLERNKSIPFDLERIYYLYKTQDQNVRGVHAHKKLEQIIISFSGKYQILLDDGVNKATFTLDDPSLGLYVCPMIWREVTPIGDCGVCVVLASRKYEEDDYIHEYSDFLKLVESK